MEKQLRNLIPHIHKKVSPIVPLLLMIKYSSIKYSVFYLLLSLLKFFSVLIITGSFNLVNSSNNNFFVSILRNFTAHIVISKGITISNYIIGCFIIIILQLCNIGFACWYYFNLKQRKTQSEFRLSIVFIVLLHIHVIGAQFEIEYLSFAYYSYGIGSSFPIENNFPEIIVIITAVINTIFIVIINVTNYFIFQSINTPFNQMEFPVRIKLSLTKLIFVLFMENVTILESYELYASSIGIKIYKIFIFSFIGIFIMSIAIMSLKEYNFRTTINDFLGFLSAFIFISIIIEVIVYAAGINMEDTIHYVFIFGWKLILSFTLVYIMKVLNRRRFNRNSKKVLFKVYEYKVDINDIDTFCYLFELLSELIDGTSKSQDLIDILYEHKRDCFDEKCKCQLIQIFFQLQLSSPLIHPPHQKGDNTNTHINTNTNIGITNTPQVHNTTTYYNSNPSRNKVPTNSKYDQIKGDYSKNLLSRIGFLIETTFVQIDYSTDYHLSVLLAEYFFYFKDNSIMAYSILQTYFYSNLRRMNLYQMMMIYSISQKYVAHCTEIIQHESINFLTCYEKYRQTNDIYKKMLLFSEKYNSIVTSKESFENSLKFLHNYNTGEINKINSSYLTSINLNNIIDTIKALSMTFASIIEKICNCPNYGMIIEYYFKMYLFFNRFNAGKMPKPIKRIISKHIDQQVSYDLDRQTKSMLLDLTSLLYNEYETQQYTYNIIIKFSKGFKIIYFSEKLANELGFAYTSLIDEELEVIFPQKLRELHHKSMINYLITNHHYSYEHNSCIFTSQGHSIPSTMKISSLPGLAKNIIIICNLKMNQNDNKYSFILNDHFEAVTLSETFDSKYSLNLKLVNNFDINLFELFNVNQGDFMKNFKKQLKEIEQFKASADVSTVLAFSKYLFNGGHNIFDNKIDTNDFTIPKFKVFELQQDAKIKEKDLMKSKANIEILYSSKNHNGINDVKLKTNAVILQRSKSAIVQNLIKLITKFNEMEVYDERYKSLNETLYKFKSSMKSDTYFDEKIKETADFIESIAMSKYCDGSYYNLKIMVKRIYDKAIYLVKINEIQGSAPREFSNKKITVELSPCFSNFSARRKIKEQLIVGGGPPSSKFATKPDTNPSSSILVIPGVAHTIPQKQEQTQALIESKEILNQSSKIQFEYPSMTKISQKDYSRQVTQKKMKQMKKTQIPVKHISIAPTIAKSTTTKKKIKKLLITINQTIHFRDDIRQKLHLKKKLSHSSTIIIICLFICLFVSLGLTLALSFFQKDILNIYHLLFFNIQHVLYQRDKILNLYCNTLSILYQVSTITSTNPTGATDDDLLPYYIALEENGNELDNGYHHFYSSYLELKNKKNQVYSEMIDNKDFQQIKLNWMPMSYKSDYFSQIQYLSILQHKVILHEETIVNLSIDADMFLFNKFIKNPETRVMTDFGCLMFYLGANYINIYEKIFTWLIDLLDKAFNRHHLDSLIYFLIIQMFIVLVYIIFFALVFYYLYKHNDIIFKGILRMFVCNSSGDEYTFKNQFYNYSLMQKVNELINLIRNFTIDNITPAILNDKSKKQFNMFSFTQLDQSGIGIGSLNGSHIKSSNQLSSKNIHKHNKITSSLNKTSTPKNYIKTKTQRNYSTNSLIHRNQFDSHSFGNSHNNTSSSNNNSTLTTHTNNTTNSQILLTKKNTKASSGEIDEMDEKKLTKTLLLQITENSGLLIIKWLQLASAILFSLFIVYFLISAITSISYLGEIELIFDDFFGFVNYYSLVYIYFNELRIKLISPLNRLSDDLFNNMDQTILESNQNTTIFINTRLKKFRNTYALFNSLNQNVTQGTEEDLEMICFHNTQCMTIVKEGSNEIIAKGINMSISAIIYQLSNMYGDYNRTNNDIITVENVKKLLKGNRYEHIDEALNFVMSNVKEALYAALNKDENEINKGFEVKANIFNYVSFAYCFIVFVLVMVGIVYNIQRNIKLIVYGAYKINQSFYYSYLEDQLANE